MSKLSDKTHNFLSYFSIGLALLIYDSIIQQKCQINVKHVGSSSRGGES